MITLHKIRRSISDAWYYIRCKCLHPHNVVRISTLPPTWVDRDEVMLHGCFQILKDFIEEEKALELIDWEHDERHRHTASELKELYNWWTAKRPARVLPEFERDDDLDIEEIMSLMSKSPNKEIAEERHRLEDEWQHEDDEMLKRLIAIRQFLWT